MPSGTPIEQFADFMYNTGPADIRGPEDFINELQRNTYLTSTLNNGRLTTEICRGGSSIQDTIILDGTGGFQWGSPGVQITAGNPQISRRTSVGWRFAYNYMAWMDQEVTLNGALSDMTKSARFRQYKDLKRIKYSGLWINQWNGIEDSYWYDPNSTATYNEMENSTGTNPRPYSIPVFINEYTNGLPTGWTNKMGINPATDTLWQPALERYKNSDINDAGQTQTGLLNAFNKMNLKTQFIPIASGPGSEYMEKNKTNRKVIACSRVGIDTYAAVLRANNDSTLSAQDPNYTNPLFAGQPLTYISNLDTIAIYPGSGGNNQTEFGATVTNAGARYYFINGDYLFPVFHDEYYMKQDKPIKPPNQPDANIMWVRNWMNNFCRSNRRLGLVAPGAA